MRTSSTSAAGWRVSERASERTRTKRCSPCLLSRRFHRRSPPSSSSSSCMQPIVFYFIPCLLRSCTLALLLLLSSSPSSPSSSLCYGTYFAAAVSLSSYCLTASHPSHPITTTTSSASTNTIIVTAIIRRRRRCVPLFNFPSYSFVFPCSFYSSWLPLVFVLNLYNCGDQQFYDINLNVNSSTNESGTAIWLFEMVIICSAGCYNMFVTLT